MSSKPVTVASPGVARATSPFLLGAGLFAATLLAYARTIRADFIWNDSDYVTAPALRSLAGLGRIWFEVGATEQYYPFLHSAFWVQHRLWGDATTGYHLTNIFLHAGAACLLAAVLRRLAMPGAWLAAFLFALHPVCVESVAWISEQKNTLSLVFYLLAALAYYRFEDERSGRRYAVATGLFVIALLSKSVTATLPAALLVIRWWQAGRLDWRRDVRPLLPWFVLGAAMGIFSAWVEKKFIGAEGAEFALTGLERSLLAGRIVWFYLGKLLWPADLIFIYPRWAVSTATWWQWLFPLGVLAALVALWRWRGRSRALLAAILFFGGSLFPTLGFFNVYAFIFSFVADHWQYLPCIGILTLLAAGLTRALVGTGPWLRRGVPALLVAGLGVLTFHQSHMYADMVTFYQVTLARNPAAWMAHNNLGGLLREAGKLDAAREHYEAALAARPDLEKVHNNLGTILREQGRPAEAAGHFRRALELRPDYVGPLNNLGSLLRQQRQVPEALALLQRAVQLEPDFADTRNNLGMALRDAGRMPEAIAEFERALALQPDQPAVHLNLALTLSLLGRDAESMRHYETARRLNPAIPALPR